ELYLATAATHLSSKVAAYIAADLRRDILASSLRTEDLGTISGSTTYTATCLSADVSAIQEHIFLILGVYIPVPLLIFLMMVNICIINESVSTLIIGALVMVCVATYFLTLKVGPVQAERMTAMDDVNRSLREKVTGARAIRTFGGLEYEKKKFSRFSDRFGRLNIASMLQTYYVPSLMTAAVWITISFIFMIAALNISSRMISIVDLVLFMQFTTYIVSSLTLIPYLCIEVPRSKVSLHRIWSSMVEEPEKREVTVSGDGPTVSIEGLTLDDRFGRRVIEGLDLTIPEGRFTSIIGPNSCGKTELVDMFLGFSAPASGRVSLCGMDLSTTPHEAIRRAISYSGKNVSVFRASLRFNLDPYGEVDDRRILDVCRRAGFDKVMDALGVGLDTELSPDSMSGGQKQLMGITRSLVKEARLYIFDDCFFSLDEDVRAHAIECIEGTCRGKNVIFTGHDTLTAEISDTVFLMDGGRIVDSGSHEELASRSPLYSDMDAKYHGGAVGC
ncbi:MAG: ABC transporter ATP-binding protein, partial [Candidatus Methanomethylophilaceae archaeon]|nr:ABC transporter ATP-binding protein [Candidatus Methanomethylophilaceae archaeon]